MLHLLILNCINDLALLSRLYSLKYYSLKYYLQNNHKAFFETDIIEL